MFVCCTLISLRLYVCVCLYVCKRIAECSTDDTDWLHYDLSLSPLIGLVSLMENLTLRWQSCSPLSENVMETIPSEILQIRCTCSTCCFSLAVSLMPTSLSKLQICFPLQRGGQSSPYSSTAFRILRFDHNAGKIEITRALTNARC